MREWDKPDIDVFGFIFDEDLLDAMDHKFQKKLETDKNFRFWNDIVDFLEFWGDLEPNKDLIKYFHYKGKIDSIYDELSNYACLNGGVKGTHGVYDGPSLDYMNSFYVLPVKKPRYYFGAAYKNTQEVIDEFNNRLVAIAEFFPDEFKMESRIVQINAKATDPSYLEANWDENDIDEEYKEDMKKKGLL